MSVESDWKLVDLEGGEEEVYVGNVGGEGVIGSDAGGKDDPGWFGAYRQDSGFLRGFCRKCCKRRNFFAVHDASKVFSGQANRVSTKLIVKKPFFSTASRIKKIEIFCFIPLSLPMLVTMNNALHW